MSDLTCPSGHHFVSGGCPAFWCKCACEFCAARRRAYEEEMRQRLLVPVDAEFLELWEDQMSPGLSGSQKMDDTARIDAYLREQAEKCETTGGGGLLLSLANCISGGEPVYEGCTELWEVADFLMEDDPEPDPVRRDDGALSYDNGETWHARTCKCELCEQTNLVGARKYHA